MRPCSSSRRMRPSGRIYPSRRSPSSPSLRHRWSLRSASTAADAMRRSASAMDSPAFRPERTVSTTTRCSMRQRRSMRRCSRRGPTRTKVGCTRSRRSSPQPWPLSLSWEKGGEIEVDQEAWESLDRQLVRQTMRGETAHVGRLCLRQRGRVPHVAAAGLDPRARDLTAVGRAARPAALALMPYAFVGFGIPLEGDDYHDRSQCAAAGLRRPRRSEPSTTRSRR